jgi:hypothetical protein
MGGRGTLAVVNALIHGLKVLGRSDFITGRLLAKWCRGWKLNVGGLFRAFQPHLTEAEAEAPPLRPFSGALEL